MRIHWFVGKRRLYGDTRITLIRFLSGKWEYQEGWKASLSLHKKAFFWHKDWQNFYVTVFFINLHVAWH